MTPFDRLFRCMTRPWVMATYGFFLVLSFMFLDRPLTTWIASIDWGLPVLLICNGLKHIGSKTPYILSLPVLALALRYLFKKRTWAIRTWFVWLAVLIPDSINLGIKILFGRARPELFLQDGLYGFQWLKFTRPFWSFPSGHTTTIMGFVFGIWIVWPRYRWILFCLGLAVMASRLFLLQHYLSDVMTAAYLTLIEVGLLKLCLQRYTPTFMQEVQA